MGALGAYLDTSEQLSTRMPLGFLRNHWSIQCQVFRGQHEMLADHLPDLGCSLWFGLVSPTLGGIQDGCRYVKLDSHKRHRDSGYLFPTVLTAPWAGACGLDSGE